MKNPSDEQESSLDQSPLAVAIDFFSQILGADKENGLVRYFEIAISEIYPAAANEDLYRAITADDPEIQSLAESILRHGIQEPLIITTDNVIISGNRRHMAAKVAGLTIVPVRQIDLHSSDPQFLTILRECNRQRKKTPNESIRESILDAMNDPAAAYEQLVEKRKRKPIVNLAEVEIGEWKERSTVSARKRFMMEAILRSLDERRDYLPTNLRAIHYDLVTSRPIKDTAKPKARYQNTLQDYKGLSKLLTDARYEGLIPMDALDDENRVLVDYDVCRDSESFVDKEVKGMFKGYYRDLLQSQPHHVELIVEKNTVKDIVSAVASRYCVPVVSGRGYASVPPRRDLDKRFRASGKDSLILIFVTDFDPEGEDLARDFAQGMRDRFGIENITPVKAALTKEQIERFNLPPLMTAKKGSSRRKGFVAKNGEAVFELEAIKPGALQSLVKDAIESVLDMDAFHREQDQEAKDAAMLAGTRLAAMNAVKDITAGFGMEAE